MSNSLIAMVKDTSLAANITVVEMFRATEQINARVYEPLALYIKVGLIYPLFSTVLTWLQTQGEQRAEAYGAEVPGVDDFIQTIELLHSGRIDATLNAEVSYYDYMAQHPDRDIRIACIDPATTQVAIPMRKGEETKALRDAVDQALTELMEDGTPAELSNKYFGTDISKAR